MPRLLGLLLAALALAACGESDDDYRDEFPPIDRELAVLADDVTASLRGAAGSDDEALARAFGGYARRMGGLRERLGELEPPAPLVKAHDELLAEMRAAAEALTAVSTAARGGDTAAARDAATALVRATVRLEAARRDQARAVGA